MLFGMEKASMIYWELAKRFWKPLAGAFVLLLAYLWFNHELSVARNEGAQQCLSEQKVQADKDVEQGKKAVENALANAERSAAEDAANHKRAADEQLKQANQAAESLHVKNLYLQKRYEKALIQDKSCAAWSQQTVSCPLE